MTTHPETVTLPHSGLQVPTEHPRVVALSVTGTGSREVLTARVRLADREIGTIGTKGAGGALLYQPADPAAFGYDWLNAFAASCQQHGRAVSTQRVLTLMVEEHEVADHLLRALADDQTLARYVVYGYTDHVITVKLTVPIRDLDLTPLADDLADVAEEDGGRWQIWTGTTWQQLPDPSTAGQDGTDR